MRQGFYDRNGVEMILGTARFVDRHTVVVGDRSATFESIVIATGSRPYHPEDVDFAHPRVFDSDSILDLSFTPKSITIYGAGVIGHRAGPDHRPDRGHAEAAVSPRNAGDPRR